MRTIESVGIIQRKDEAERIKENRKARLRRLLNNLRCDNEAASALFTKQDGAALNKSRKTLCFYSRLK